MQIKQILKSYLEKSGITQRHLLFKTYFRYHLDWERAKRELFEIKVSLGLKSVSNLKILDVGCGTGLLANLLNREKATVVAIDIVPQYIKIGKMRDTRRLTEFLVGSAEALPFQKGVFDLVICNQLFEHLNPYQQEACVGEVSRVLNSGGKFYITAENKFWPYDSDYKLFWVRFMPKFLADRYVRLRKRVTLIEGRTGGYDVHPVTYGRLLKLLKRYGLSADSAHRTRLNKKFHQIDKLINWFAPGFRVTGIKINKKEVA